MLRARRRLGTDGYGLVLANPIAPADEMDRALHDRVLAAALAAAEAEGVRGKDVTPFLLDFFHRETHGASLVGERRAGAVQRPVGGGSVRPAYGVRM